MKYVKKSNVTVSMSWVFMILIGGFFIFFAYSVIDKYQENEELKYEVIFKNSLRNILNNVGRTAGIEENSLEPIDNLFKEKSAEIKCIDVAGDKVPLFWINDGKIVDENNEFMRYYPIYMTYIEQEKISTIYMAVESLRIPFKTTNLLAIVSKKNLVVFNNNSDIADKFIEKFTKGSYDELHLEFRDFTIFDAADFKTEFEDYNLNSVIFVSDKANVGVIKSELNQIDDLDIMNFYLEINEDSGGEYGTLRYYDSSQSAPIAEFPYIDYDNSLGMPTMAIFSSPETYGCTLTKLYDSALATYDFYIRKARFLKSLSTAMWTCSPSIGAQSLQVFEYESIEDKLKEIRAHIETKNFNNPGDLTILLKELEVIERKLEEFNCFFVY